MRDTGPFISQTIVDLPKENDFAGALYSRNSVDS